MKKIIILASILLMAILVSAFEINSESKSTAKEIADTILSNVENEPQKIDKRTRRKNIRRIKSILKDSIGSFITRLELVGDEQVISSYYYYDAGKIAKKLEETNLKTFLENDQEALDEIADYAVRKLFVPKPENDFEVLLVIGVNPIEAAIRTNHEDYLQSALETGEIKYTCFKRRNEYQYTSPSAYETIPVIADETEINNIRDSLSFRRSGLVTYDKI